MLGLFDFHPPQYFRSNCSPIGFPVDVNPKQTNASWLLAWEFGTNGAFKSGQHAAWPVLFRKAHAGLKGLGEIIGPAEWRPRHSVALI